MRIKSYSVKKGVTFIEVVISVAIFAAVVASASASFITSIQSKKNIEVARGDYEKAQLAMNLVGKSLRTSSVVSTGADSTSTIKIFDYSQDLCIQYRFSNSRMLESATQIMDDPIVAGETKKEQCASANPSIYNALTNVYVDGSFKVTPSDEDAKVRGMVTISMKVCPSADTCMKSSDYAIMQTTVSLRDYFEI